MVKGADSMTSAALDAAMSSAHLLRRRDRQFADVVDRLLARPYQSGALTAKVASLVCLAAESVIPEARPDRMRTVIVAAREAGASADEVLNVLEISCSLGLHSVSVGLPILLEEMDRAGLPLPEAGPRHAELREFFEVRRVRTRKLEGLYASILQMDEEYFDARLRMIDLPWERRDILDDEIKHLVSIAIDVVCPNLFESGIRLHVRQSLEIGVAPEAIWAVIQLASATSMRTLDVALPLFDEAFPQ